MTSGIQPLWTSDPVAANVRAELARKGVSVNRLQFLIGRNQAYWQRRTGGRTEFSHTDLIALADLLGVDPGVFFVGATGMEKPSAGDGGRPVRRQGLEPRTRYFVTEPALASSNVIELPVRPTRSNPEPIGFEVPALAEVIELRPALSTDSTAVR